MAITSKRTHASPQAKEVLHQSELLERKAVEEQLNVAENQYHRLFEASRDGMLIVDARTQTISDANPFMTELLGCIHEQLVGRELWQIGLFQNQEAVLKVFHDLQERYFVRYEALPLHSKDGVRRYVEFIGNLYQANGVDVIQCHVRDVTDSLRAEETRLHLAAIVESSDDAILSKNLDGIITSWNAGAQRIYGYSAQEIVGQPVTRLFLPDKQDEFMHIMARIRRGERVASYETTRVRKDGARLAVSVTVSPIKDSNGIVIGASAIARDITERKQLEARLQEQDKRKDEFISMASHELKTPVTSLKGFLSLLQRRLTIQEDEKALHYLQRMDAQVNKLTKLINDLLDLSKMQTGQLAYRKEPVELDALVQEVLENIQETTQTHHIQLEGQSQAQVFGDRDRIGQVLINLLNNAIKYSPQADTVLLRVIRDNDNVLVSVQDFGIGIAREYQPRVFERFYQVTDAEGKTYPGLGIGLYISHEIVRRHGGQMWVESEKGKGATFSMTLPLL